MTVALVAMGKGPVEAREPGMVLGGISIHHTSLCVAEAADLEHQAHRVFKGMAVAAVNSDDIFE